MSTLLLHLAILSCCLLSWSHPSTDKLRFTSNFYNVTIPENSVSRTLVTSARRMGVTRTTSDDVTFKITSGDPDRIFKVEDKPVGDFIFLVLRTRGGSSVVLNRERKDKFVLTIKAFSTRTSFEATAIVYVRVVDQNDLSPIFVPPSYNATLPEDFEVFKPILRVSAEDADLGVNGEIVYSIKESSDQFTIHPFTGVLALTSPLRYSERSMYDLTIVAQDRATVFRGGGQSSFAKVTVRVRQVNLFGPEIYVYVLQEPSPHRLGWTYAVARVLDRDEGIHGEIGSVRIVNGDSSLFTVVPVEESNNRTEYNIVLLNRFIDENIYSLVNLSLQVTDRGFPQRKSYKGISIRLKRVVDNEPRFLNESYEINVPEYLPQGSPLIRLSILNKEHFLSDRFSVIIKDGNVNESFRVYRRKFVLCTNKPLDSEKIRVFTLTLLIVDKDGKSVRKGSMAKVKVNILDFNDNAPVFNNLPDEVWINENMPAGAHVFKVSSTDRDTGDNGQVTYSIANTNRIPFEIDPLSGVIRTTQPLDYEHGPHIYFLKVRASDSGAPFRLESQKTISVKVRNINDNSPEFTKGECSLSIPKNLRVGSDLFAITATDLDENDTISYSVSSSSREDCIKIDVSKGMLSLQCDLSEVSTPEWDVNITANDGLHKAQAYLRVFVVSLKMDAEEFNLVQYSCRDVEMLKDDPAVVKLTSLPVLVNNAEYETPTEQNKDNENYPLFTNLPESLNMKETLPVGEVVYKLEAFDKDEGINGKIVFGLTSTPEDYILKIDVDTGIIYVFSEINYDYRKQYMLSVSVCDLGKSVKCSHGNIMLNILDSNKYAPEFNQSQYKIHIPENTKVGEEVFKISAIDRDESSNQSISYYLTFDNVHFSVDRSGSITLKRPLDREKAQTLTITVKAADGDLTSNDTLCSEVVVTFYVENVNDNVPIFVNTHLSAIVPEDLPVGSVIYIVNVVDRDDLQDLKFSIDNELFKIDPSTGVIRLADRLDYETLSEHRITITVSDDGKPSLNNSETIVITVTDVNENLHPPMFDEVFMAGTVREGLPIGTMVTSVSAGDADLLGVDSKVVYSLRGGSGMGLFSITEQGNIYTASVLDAEHADHYWLTVIARDCGLLPLSTTIQVFISVSDYNDRLPLSSEPFYSFSVEENLPSLTVVGYVTAADDDASVANHANGDNRRGTNLMYSLSSSSKALPFTIESHTGLISTTRLLDREDVQEYVIEVVIADRGSPSLSSITEVRVTVVDVNDHSPQFTLDHYIVKPHHLPQALSQSSVHTEMRAAAHEYDSWRWHTIFPEMEILPLLQVLAVDKDEGDNGNVTYSISTDSPFTINSKTGTIYTLIALEPGDKYDFQVKASDHGRPSRSSIAKVTVYTPDNPRTLSRVRGERRMTVQVEETSTSGDVVLTFHSPDGESSSTSYFITGGGGASHFAAVADRLLTFGSLDAETMSEMRLNMAAVNSTHIWNMQIDIHIVNVNEYHPRFLEEEYLLNVTEDTPTGTILTSLQAQDADVTSHFRFSPHNAHPGSDMFLVDPTGDVILTKPLDRELAGDHLLTVRVSDGDARPKFGYARVHITVLDVNDHPPQFSGDSLSVRVSEDLQVGSLVETVVAADVDLGESGEISYSIVSGNLNDTFKINPETGDIFVNSILDTYKTGSYHLIVKATDKGSPPLESRINLNVGAVPSEKKMPFCIDNPSWTEAPENTRVGEVIGFIRVNPLPFLAYEIVAGDPDRKFSVNPTTGDLLLVNPLDYETTSRYNLTVRVTSRAGLQSDCFTTVYVTDYNDNVPKFKKESYVGFVHESTQAGQLIMTENGPLKILVEDLDSGENAMLEFIVRGSKGKNLLEIDSFTGTVRTTAPLDYEELKEIEATISVRDLGSPSLTAPSVASLRVVVKDVNDSPPQFLQRGYNATILLPTEADVFVAKVTAEDEDTEEVTELEYSIVGGNEDAALSINQSTGEIFVNDHRKLNRRVITIKVFDGAFHDTTTVDILVQTHHPSSIKFQKDIYQAAVMENSTKISIVAVVSLLGSFLDENIRFSILNRKRNPSFSIGQTSGIISTVGDVFDRERQDFYNLIVKAHSLDRNLVAFTRVNVSVLDANDNCPQFLNLPYRATIARNATRGEFVTKITAVDPDAGESGEVRYELDQPGSEMFRVGRRSGEIRVKNLGMMTKEAAVTVKAYDGGIIPCYSSAILTVAVVDTSAPQWQRAVYKASVPEDAQLFYTVPVTLKATADHKVIYQLINSSDFLLRHDSGELQVYAPLDRETLSLHRLQVRAIDSVTGTASDTVVLLEVEDVNDHPPVFLGDVYRARVAEGAAGTVLQVAAVDVDRGNNGSIRYSLLDSHFRVGPTDGKLEIVRPLDYEAQKQHILKVIATDMGTPPRSSHVYVVIDVININDNAPEIVPRISKFAVSQDADRGFMVGKIVAFDEDRDTIFYRAYSHDDAAMKTFSVNVDNGVITLANPKELRVKNKFVLNITVEDGIYSTFGVVEVHVLPRNRNPPKFNQDLYETEVEENKPAGTLVIRASAYDKDLGSFGNISFILPPQRSSGFFTLDKYSGDIRTRTPLDREERPVHTLDIMVRDGGGLISWAQVKVKVIDKNDNKPLFELPQYFGCVGSDKSEGQEIIKIRATDSDEGLAGAVSYSLVSARPAEAINWFQINSTNGALKVKHLDIMEGPIRVRLTARASDAGSPPLHSDVIVSLTMSRDLLPPPIRSFPSRLSVPVDAERGFVVHHFQEKAGAKLNLSVTGNGDQFAINSSGHLYIKERSLSYCDTIGILAQYHDEKLTTCAFYMINIDKYPIRRKVAFVQDEVELTLPEDIAVGTFIHRVSTTEDDPTVLFSLTAPSSVFTVDPTTGWVSLAAPLDRETQAAHDVTIVASAPGAVLQVATCDVRIVVTDANDNPHIFSQEVYNVAVKEDAPVATETARLSLVDPDTTHDVIHYVITEGDDDVMFAMTEDGRIVVARALDREVQTGYSLTVAATDGVHIASATVNVVVIDVDNKPHQCLHSLYNVTVVESQPPGHLVTSIMTFDPDLETSLTYHLTGEGHERFYVDNHGDLRLKQYLDRETTESYILEVEVSDSSHPAWTCTSAVRVTVDDVNDNAPSFAVYNETVMVTEDAVVGMILTRINVLDYDLGPNRTVRFSLVDPSGLFTLSSDSGLLALAEPLPNGPGSVYHVTVRATDLGSPPLSSNSTLQVVVLGMNDDPPVYLSGSYHVTVAEDVPLATSLLQLRPLGEDPSRRSTPVHTILEGNAQGVFDIDRRTGLLITNKPLDYEARQSYQLLILTTSVGDSSVTSYSSVNISVLDVNDNPPLFKVNRFSVQIREDIEVGQIVLKIEAIDVDSGPNGMVRYSLDADSMQHFAIDLFNGILMVLSSLDREKQAHHNISVEAADQGFPPLVSTAHVYVEVLDVNDNPPVFATPNVTTVLQADRMPGWAVYHFLVTDADLMFNTTFTFNIVEGNGKEMFRVDNDGTLRTTEKLNIKLGDHLTLGVRVEDSTDPTLFSSTWIYIKVVEPSKHPPVLHPLRVWVGVYEHQWGGGDLGVLTSSDLDPYDKLEFSVPSNPQFSIDPRHGVLRARGGLSSGTYHVNVSVTDGKFTTTSRVTVSVEPLRQDMLQTSVYIRLSPRMKPQMLAAKLPQFISTLRSAFLKEVRLISVQDNPNSTTGLLIAVDGGADLTVVREVMSTCGIPGTTPQCDCRNGGVCQRQLQMMPEKTSVVTGQGVSFVTPGHSLTYYCICSMGYAGDHCEEIKCLCPPLQVCVPQKVGFTCIPPCSANQTCPAAMTSAVTWPELVTSLLASTAVITTVAVFVVYRRYRRTPGEEEKFESWGKQNCQTKKKSKLSNLMKSQQKPPIFTGSPNNGTIGRNNFEGPPTTMIEGDVIPLDYLRNINPVSKTEKDILQGHSSAPDLATCHVADVVVSTEDPARGLAALDDQLSQEVVQYGFPPQGTLTSLPEELEVSL